MLRPLERIATIAPLATFYRISNLDRAGDAAITTNDSDDATIFLAAANALRNAEKDWRDL